MWLIRYSTGAGKSSIMTVIYRMVEVESGSICIDGVDIATVGLEQLRKGLSIIPQDAVSGTRMMLSRTLTDYVTCLQFLCM